jgi:hypothetical protein
VTVPVQTAIEGSESALSTVASESVVTDQSPSQTLRGSRKKTSPYDIAPLPQAQQRVEGRRKRKSESSTVLTSTPHKDYLKSLSAKKPKTRSAEGCKKPHKTSRAAKKLVFDKQSSETTNTHPKKTKRGLPRVPKPSASSSSDNTPCCICICGKRFNEPPADSWTQCPQCKLWYHDSCGPDDTVPICVA